MVRNISRLELAASAEKVWAVLTDPYLVKRWQYGSELATTWQIGTPIRFTNRWQDTIFEQWGIVLEFQPGVRLRYSLFAPRPGLEDSPANAFEMLYLLRQEGDRVALEIIQEDPRPGAVQEDPQGEENPVLAELKKVAEQ